MSFEIVRHYLCAPLRKSFFFLEKTRFSDTRNPFGHLDRNICPNPVRWSPIESRNVFKPSVNPNLKYRSRLGLRVRCSKTSVLSAIKFKISILFHRSGPAPVFGRRYWAVPVSVVKRCEFYRRMASLLTRVVLCFFIASVLWKGIARWAYEIGPNGGFFALHDF